MIRRAPHETSYAVIRNEAIRDKRLSFKARGLLTLLLSMPDDWRVTSRWLAGQGPDGRDAVMSGLRELEAAGYLRRSRHHDGETGQWVHDSVVYETPNQPDCPGSGLPTAGSSARENPTIEEVPIDEVPSEQVPTGQDLAPVAQNGKRRDLVFESLMAACGVGLDQIPKSARGKYNTAAKDLRDLGATPEAIAARAHVYREKWPEVSMTPNALAVHWGECDPDRQHRPVDPYAEMLERLANEPETLELDA